MKLFVYGTLKRTHPASALLAGQSDLGPVRTVARYRLYDCGGFPGLVEDPAGLSVEGELWEIDDACRAALDDYEGVAEALYVLRPIDLLDHPPDVFAYFHLGDTTSLPDAGANWPPSAPE